VALMTLFEKGAFQLDDPLSKYAPEFANTTVYAGTDPSGNAIFEAPHREITIRDLTRHTTGFATGGGDAGVGPLFQTADPMNRQNTLPEMAAKLGTVPLIFHPGEQWAYGVSVDVQAFLVERISGVPYEQYVRENVLDPLGMHETRYFVPEADRDRFAAMYQRGADGSITQQPEVQAHGFNTNRWRSEARCVG